MADFTESVLVPAFFIHTAAGTLSASTWFAKNTSTKARSFGLGLFGYGLALAIWTALVLIKPNDLKPLVLIGAIPFLLASFAFVRSATDGMPARFASILFGLVGALVAATFVVRTFVYPSHPFFSGKGLFYFGLDPLAAGLYIMTISASFLPALLSVTAGVADPSKRMRLRVGLLALYANAIVMLSSISNTLLLINGTVLTAALVLVWSTSLSLAFKPSITLAN